MAFFYRLSFQSMRTHKDVSSCNKYAKGGLLTTPLGPHNGVMELNVYINLLVINLN